MDDLLDPLVHRRLVDAILSLQPTTLHVRDASVMRDIASGWDAAYTGSPTLASPALPTLPSGVSFSGTGQYATTSGSAPTPSASMSVLAVFSTTDATAATRHIFARGAAASQFSWSLRLGSGHKSSFAASQTSGSNHCAVNSTGSVMNDGLPHLIVGSFDGATASIGDDNRASPSTSTSLTGSWHKASTAGIQIAASNSTNLFPGTVYAVAYWADRVITDAERLWLNSIMRGA